MRLLLVRHGESVWNMEGRWQGQADPPLSEAGAAQARLAADALDGFSGRIVSSDLMRARRTAEIIAETLGLGEVHVVPGVREIDVGAWSGLTHAEIEARFPGQLERYRAGALAGPPGGESRAVFLERVLAALDDIAGAGERTLVVTHGGVINHLERHLGVYPGRGFANLEGRWFRARPRLAPDGDRIALVPSRPPSAEAR